MCRKIPLYLSLLLLFLIAGCKHKLLNNSVVVPALKGNWYKRYKGTIGRDTIVLNLYYATVADSNEGLPYSGGTYYYSGKSGVIDIAVTADSASPNVLHITEVPGGASLGDDTAIQYNTLTLALAGTEARGRFHKAYRSNTDSVILRENYDGACRLRILMGEETLNAKNEKWSGSASAVCVGIQPDKQIDSVTSAFILQSVVGGSHDTVKVNSIVDYIGSSIKQYLQDFKDDIAKLNLDTTLNDICMHRYELRTIFPVYNDRGMLITKNSWYGYACGAHGMYGYSYVTMDVTNRKLLLLADIINIDKKEIGRLLNTEAVAEFRNEHKVTPDFPAYIDMTDNFYVDDKGITFCYSPNEISGFAFGEIKLSIPYTSLKYLLKPDFVARMGLKL